MFDIDFAEKEHVEVHNYKCPSCGAQMEFSPETQSLFCPHCHTSEQVEFSSNVTERNFSELTAHQQWTGDVKAVRCENCGAEEVLAQKEISTRCPFCGSNTVLKEGELSSVKPDTVIPFKINKETAVQKCLKWLKSKIFAPGYFKKHVTIDTMAGTYNPVWTFDSSTRTAYHGTLGKTVVYTTTINGKTVTRTEIRWFNVSGNVDCNFDDLYVPGADRINEKVMMKLKPYDQTLYVRYNNDLLAGFVANNYTVPPLEAWKRAEARMYETIRNMIIQRHNADTVRSLNMSVNHLKKSFKYLLLPVYVAATTYKGKLYNQYINGVHGKVAGQVPLSAPKISIAAFIGVALIAGIIALVMLL